MFIIFFDIALIQYYNNRKKTKKTSCTLMEVSTERINFHMKHIPYRLAEALENICKRKALENITVREIATEAGVTRQVFYHYFVDKYELALWINYVHLYQSVKLALKNDSKHMWRLTTTYWMQRMLENKAFYTNAFSSVSQKEFQRIIRDFFYGAYKWQMEQRKKQVLTEVEAFVLHLYLYGGMEKIYEWVSGGMNVPVERMVQLLECSMPEAISKWILTEENVPYQEAVKMMEAYLSKEGLLPVNS